MIRVHALYIILTPAAFEHTVEWDTRTEEMLMFFIDRKNARRLREESDPSRWHTAFIWWPRFVLVSTTGHEPFWQFVGIGKTIRRSIGSELIGSWKIHRWVYQTDVSFAR